MSSLHRCNGAVPSLTADFGRISPSCKKTFLSRFESLPGLFDDQRTSSLDSPVTTRIKCFSAKCTFAPESAPSPFCSRVRNTGKKPDNQIANILSS